LYEHRNKKKFKFVFVKRLLIILCFSSIICSAFAQEQDPEYYEKGDLLLYYADLGDLNLVKVLIEQKNADVNYLDGYGVSALMLASQAGYDSVVLYLISQSADVNAQSLDFKFSPLISAVKNNHLSTAQILIRNWANIDDQDVFGRTALHYAAQYGLLHIADMLLYYDADVDIQDVTGYTPLCYAVENKFDDIVLLLKLEEAETGFLLRDSSDIFHIAAANGNLFFLQTFESDLELTENKYGLTPFETAITGGQSKVVSWMLDEDYKYKDTIKGIYTPRTLAKYSGDHKTKKIFRKLKIKEIHYPYINKIGIGFDMIFNGDDFFMAFNSAVSEARYGFILETGFLFRGGERRILYPFAENSYYQLREQRNGLYFKLDKNFKLFNTGAKTYLSFFGGVRATYYWGKYDGVQMKVLKQMIASPSVGLALNSGAEFRMFFMCDYLNLPICLTNPLFYSVGFKMMVNFRKEETNEKYKYIIKY